MEKAETLADVSFRPPPLVGERVLLRSWETSDAEAVHAYASDPEVARFAENEKSRRAALKMGLTLDGVLRSSLCFRGRRWDEAIYSVLHSEWLTSAR